MIQANELRVGNFVYYKKGKHFYDVRAVCRDRVHPINIVEHDRNVRYAMDCTLSDLSPIPLTPDTLLEKSNFKEQNSSEFWRHFVLDNGWYISQWVHEKKVAGFEEKYVFYWGEIYKPIKFVHKLQNFYYEMMDKELQINL